MNNLKDILNENQYHRFYQPQHHKLTFRVNFVKSSVRLNLTYFWIFCNSLCSFPLSVPRSCLAILSHYCYIFSSLLVWKLFDSYFSYTLGQKCMEFLCVNNSFSSWQSIWQIGFSLGNITVGDPKYFHFSILIGKFFGKFIEIMWRFQRIIRTPD